MAELRLHKRELKPTRHDSNMIIKAELKNQLLKEMRLRVQEYTSGEYVYMLLDSGLALIYTTFN